MFRVFWNKLQSSLAEFEVLFKKGQLPLHGCYDRRFVFVMPFKITQKNEMSWWFSPSSGRRLTFAGCFLALSHLPVPWRRRKRSGGEFGGSWWEYRFFPYFFWLYLHMSRWWKMQHLRFKITCMLCQLPTRTGGGLFVGAGSIHFFFVAALHPCQVAPSSSVLLHPPEEQCSDDW